MTFGLRTAKMLGQLFVQLVSKIFNLCGHDPPTLQTGRQTDRRHCSASRGKNPLVANSGVNVTTISTAQSSAQATSPLPGRHFETVGYAGTHLSACFNIGQFLQETEGDSLSWRHQRLVWLFLGAGYKFYYLLTYFLTINVTVVFCRAIAYSVAR